MSALQTIPLTPTATVNGGAFDPADPGETVLALLEAHAQRHPLNRALVMLDGDRGHAVTYIELAGHVKRLAAWLSARFPEGGEPIAVLSNSGPAWAIVALATLASRNVLVPLDGSAERDVLLATLRRVRPALIACSSSYHDIAAAAPSGGILALEPSRPEVTLPTGTATRTRADAFTVAPDTAVLAFTSGTTATPKAVEISFANLLFQIRSLTTCFALRPSDRLLSLLPMHHMLEFTAGFLCPLWSGAQIHYLPSLLPGEALERMRTLGITRVVTVPAWLALLKRTLEHGARNGGRGAPSSRALRSHARRALGADFEHFVCGGAPLADELDEFFHAIAAPVVQGYGLTETSPVVATNTLAGCRRGSVGRPLRGTETAISDDGEILVRGPQVAGRYRLEGGTAGPVADPQGWFHTGDLGHMDSEGFLYVTGRIKTTIVLANGKNVQPEEIETRLEGCDAVAEAGVVGITDENATRGAEICLVVVPAADLAGACGSAEAAFDQAMQVRIRQALGSLASYKRPRRVILRERPLPRTASGKLHRPELTEWVLAQAGAR
jgi:long-chain acyl-CoA synthetase